MPPKAARVSPVTGQMGEDRPATWQADLPTMGVAGQVELETGIGGDPRRHHRMDQGDAKAVWRGAEGRWRGAEGRWHSVGVEIVHIVSTGQVDGIAIPFDGPALTAAASRANDGSTWANGPPFLSR